VAHDLAARTGVPYIWFCDRPALCRADQSALAESAPLLLSSSGALGGVLLLLLILNRDTFTYVGALRLLSYSDVFRISAWVCSRLYY